MVYGQPITIKNMDDLELLDMTVTSVIIEKGACEHVTSFDISQCIKLQQLTIGDKNFKNILLQFKIYLILFLLLLVMIVSLLQMVHQDVLSLFQIVKSLKIL